MVESKELLAGLAGFIALLVVGAVFGRLHASEQEGRAIDALGDRVACGLLAVPLIAFATHRAFPEGGLAWAFLAPTPILLYSMLLASVDLGWPPAVRHFTAILVAGFLLLYLVLMAVVLFAPAR